MLPLGLRMVACCLLCCLLAPQAGAQEARDPATDPARERMDEWRRDLNRRAALLQAPSRRRWLEPVEGETPCVTIQSVSVADDGGADVPDLSGLTQHLGHFLGACLGSRSIEALRANLEARLLDQGYVTSTLDAPPQDLAAGQLRLSLQWGRIESVRLDPGALPADAVAAWGQALPLRPGAALNLRDIEQALENLARLPSQVAQFRIEPGVRPGTSVVVIVPTGARPWQASLGLESTEASHYGPLQWQSRFVLDAPFGLADQLAVFASRGQGENAARQQSMLVSYSVPLGYHLLSANLSRSNHQRSVLGGVSRFEERGFDNQVQLRWQWTAWRSASARLLVWAGASARQARTQVEGTELLLQRRESTGIEAGVSHWQRHACGDLSLDAEVGRTVRFKRDAQFQTALDGLPGTWRAQAQWSCAMGWATGAADGPAWDLQGRLWAQGVSHPVNGADLVSLGSRWTVRGHPSQDILTGQRIAVLRQELLSPAAALGNSGAWRGLLALDLGRIVRPLDPATSRRSMAGAAVGMRAQWAGWVGELTIAVPLHRHALGGGHVVYGNLEFHF